MIDFACKKFDINEVIKCGFGLSKADFEVFKFFVSNKNNFFKTQDILNQIKLDLSTIQRAVKKIYSLDLLQRSQTNLSSGGYVYSYKIKDKRYIKIKILQLLDNWNSRVEAEFDKW